MSIRTWLGEHCIHAGKFLVGTETIEKPLSNTVVINTCGMDHAAAAAAIERVWQRRNAAGGFDR